MALRRALTKDEGFDVRCAKFGVALSWDKDDGVGSRDLDLQAVAFDSSGKLVDAVYYNNLKALGRGLTHSGDELTGEKQGFDEVVWTHSQRIGQDIVLICFVIGCYGGGFINDAKNGTFHLLEDSPSNEVATYRLTQVKAKAALIASLRRKAGAWAFQTLESTSTIGQHFIDILEPTIGDYVRRVIPTAPKRLKAAFAMSKGSVVDLPASAGMGLTFAGLGWDTSMGEVDLDVSAVMLDVSMRLVDTVFFGNEEAPGVKHSGDNLTGEGEGDDERIQISFTEIPSAVQQVFFVVNIYTRERTFAQVANPYCRIVTSDGEEFCRYELRDAGRDQALIMARLFRATDDVRWGFQALGIPTVGRTWKDSMGGILQQARKKCQSDDANTASFRSMSSGLSVGMEAASSSSPSAPLPVVTMGSSRFGADTRAMPSEIDHTTENLQCGVGRAGGPGCLLQ